MPSLPARTTTSCRAGDRLQTRRPLKLTGDDRIWRVTSFLFSSSSVMADKGSTQEALRDGETPSSFASFWVPQTGWAVEPVHNSTSSEPRPADVRARDPRGLFFMVDQACAAILFRYRPANASGIDVSRCGLGSSLPISVASSPILDPHRADVRRRDDHGVRTSTTRSSPCTVLVMVFLFIIPSIPGARWATSCCR